VTGAPDHFADPSHLVTPPEPRIPCPCCGAHVLVARRVSDRAFMVCPVCDLRWIEDNFVTPDIRQLTGRE
jgi:hypothetical protein